MGLSSSSSCCPGVFGGMESIVVAGTPSSGATSVAMSMRQPQGASGVDPYRHVAMQGLVLPSHALDVLPPAKIGTKHYSIIDAGPWHRCHRSRAELAKLGEGAAGLVMVCDASRRPQDQPATELLRLLETVSGSSLTPLVVLINKADLAPQDTLPHLAKIFADHLKLTGRRGPWLLQPVVARHSSFVPWDLAQYFGDPIAYVVHPLASFGGGLSLPAGGRGRGDSGHSATAGSSISNGSVGSARSATPSTEYVAHHNAAGASSTASSEAGVASGQQQRYLSSSNNSSTAEVAASSLQRESSNANMPQQRGVSGTASAGFATFVGGAGNTVVALDAFPAPTPRHDEAAEMPLRGADAPSSSSSPSGNGGVGPSAAASVVAPLSKALRGVVGPMRGGSTESHASSATLVYYRPLSPTGS